MPCEGFLCGGASIVNVLVRYLIIKPYDARNLLRAFTGVYILVIRFPSFRVVYFYITVIF